ncbi:MAG: hypothetical protein O7G85_03930 [Planctomycetota bacterium]|nr:hypothetical protein [Planctomycetota bacterium]
MTQYKIKMPDGTEFGPADLDTIVQWAKEGRIAKAALLYPEDGGEPMSVFAQPRIASILGAPPTSHSITPEVKQAKSSSGWFPTGNPLSLWGYYISVAGFLIPLLCPISLIMGCVGMVRAIQNPKAKGFVHGLVAVLFSLGSPAFWYFVFAYALA